MKNAPAVNVGLRAPSLEIDLETFRYYKQQQQKMHYIFNTLFNDFSLLSFYVQRFC